MTKTFDALKALLATARDASSGKPVANNTRLFQRENGIAYRYHATDIVTVTPDNQYILDNGGYFTVTTKQRINEYAPVYVGSTKGVWFLYRNGKAVCEYTNGMVVDADGNVVSGGAPLDTSKERFRAVNRAIKRYVDGFTAVVADGKLTDPGSGDCWHCLAAAQGSQAFGESVDHVVSHFEEQYFVPSLLYAAIVESGYRNPGFIWSMIKSGKGPTDSAKRALRKFLTKRRDALADALAARKERRESVDADADGYLTPDLYDAHRGVDHVEQWRKAKAKKSLERVASVFQGLRVVK